MKILTPDKTQIVNMYSAFIEKVSSSDNRYFVKVRTRPYGEPRALSVVPDMAAGQRAMLAIYNGACSGQSVLNTAEIMNACNGSPVGLEASDEEAMAFIPIVNQLPGDNTCRDCRA